MGKTTLVKRVIEEVGTDGVIGFVTEEIREGGVRLGFTLKTLDGLERILAHKKGASNYRVGRYRVFVDAVDEVVARIESDFVSARALIVDEIGKMECFSEKFNSFVTRALEEEKLFFLATVAARGEGLIEDIKKREDVEIYRVTLENRNALKKEISRRLRSWLRMGGNM